MVDQGTELQSVLCGVCREKTSIQNKHKFKVIIKYNYIMKYSPDMIMRVYIIMIAHKRPSRINTNLMTGLLYKSFNVKYYLYII